MACWHFLPFFQVKAIKFRKLEKCHHHPADTFPEMSVGSALIIRNCLVNKKPSTKSFTYVCSYWLEH